MIRIPKQFTLMNIDYVVRHTTPKEQSIFDEQEVVGICHEGEVILGQHRKRETFEHTYFHELSHALLDSIGRPELSADEALVDALGAALHQYEKTKKESLNLNRRKNSGIHNGKRKNDSRTGPRLRAPGGPHGERHVGGKVGKGQL